MKTLTLLVTLIGLLLLPIYGFGQCQTIIPIIDAISPPIPTGDSVLYLCQGDILQIDASGSYPENGLFYDQSDTTSTFSWSINNVEESTGQQLQYTCNDPGIVQINLHITDINGCTEEVPWSLTLVVYGPPQGGLLSNPAPPYCIDQLVDLFPDTTAGQYALDYFTYDDSPFPLPDGTGLSYFTNIFVTEFDNNAIVSPADLASISASMEHSYLRDLEIKIICPNGQEAILHDFAGQTGGEVFLGIPVESDEIGNPVPGTPFEYTWKDDSDLMTWIEYSNAFNPGTLPAGDYRSFDPFSNLEGCPLNGTWTLEVQDLWGVDNGFIFAWSLQFDSILLSNFDLPLSFEQSPINNINWIGNPAIQSLQNDTATVLVETGLTFQIEYTNDFGCTFTQDYPLENVLPPNAIACEPCDSLQISVGSFDTLSCINPSMVLSGDSNLEPNVGQFQWADNGGNILSETQQVLVAQPGQYIFTVTNPINGCVKTDSVTVASDISLPIASAGNDTVYQCVTGSVQLDGAGSSVGPDISYLWFSDQAIDQVTTLQPIVNSTGTYYLIVVNDLTGCQATDSVTVSIFPDLSFTVNTSTASCDQTDGSASVELLPGTGPATYLWSDGQTTATATNLAQGWYNVTVTVGTCSGEQAVFIDEDASCKVTIRGTIFDDSEDLNCDASGNVNPIECILVHLLPNDIYTYSDANGEYEFVVEAGAYTVEYIEEDVYNLLCPVSGSFAIDLPIDGTVSNDNDFFAVKDTVQNLSLSIADGYVRPGFNYQLNYFIDNQGTVPVSPTLTMTHPGDIFPGTLLDLVDYYDTSIDSASVAYPSLIEGGTISQTLFMEVSVFAELDDEVDFSLQVLPIQGDAFPGNNTLNYTRTVTGSFDPNDKTTFTGENEFGGAIYLPEDSTIYYQIRFQNTGTDTAFNVVIRDTLDAELNVESIRPGFASHDMQVEFEGNNVLVFRFPDILLPDSTTNEPASNGFVTYSINLKPGLPLGTEIRNSAAIYFDFNAPIITNETIHIISEPSSVVERPVPMNLSLSPNPTDGLFQLDFNLADKTSWRLSLVNSQGQEIKELRPWAQSPAGPVSFSGTVDQLPSGAYFLYLESDYQQTLIPLILQR